MRKLAALGVLMVLALTLMVVEQHTYGDVSFGGALTAGEQLAQASGLIPCSGPECQACHFVSLGQNIIDFLIMVSAAIGALIIAVAGFTMATAGGDKGKVSKGKEMMTNVVIGFIILLASWLVIDTVLKLFIGEGRLGPWNEIPCIDLPEYGEGAEIGGNLVVNPEDEENTQEGNSGVKTGTVCPLITSGSCATSNLKNYFGDQAANASQICGKESGGSPGKHSRSDIMKNDQSKRAFSIGLFQINLTVHKLQGCGATLDCKSAFTGKNYTATVKNEGLYAQCVRAAQDATCNIKNAVRIYTEAGQRWSPWSTAKQCKI